MNALHPTALAPDVPALPPAARATSHLLWRLTGFYGLFGGCLALSLLTWPMAPLAVAARSSGLAGVALGAVVLPLAGLLATLLMVGARREVGRVPTAGRPSWMRALRFGQPRPIDPVWRLSRMARRPQGVVVPAFALAAAAAVWWLRPAEAGALGSAMPLGTGAIIFGFPLLVAERIMAGVPPSRLPEAAALRRLLLVPVILVPLGGLIEIAAGAGLGGTRAAMTVLALYLGMVAAELTLRSLANWFLPPPPAAEARAAVASLAAALLQPGQIARDGLAAPIRTHLGIDFSRSWALRYARVAAVPIGLLIAAIGWCLSGVALIDPDQRGIYERLGAPVSVWPPGAHFGLPWPLGRVRRVELGVVHAVALGSDITADPLTAAEAPPPLAADRLWEGAHPAEVSFIIASIDNAGGQSFQSVSADLKLLYRVGLDDGSALQAAYGVVSPEALVRAQAGRLLTRFFAGEVLADVLGDRAGIAERQRAVLQRELAASGIELVGLVIEAIHPPAAAAQAYHNVQAAEIVARTAIATERGRSRASAAMAHQTATDQVNTAQGAAADTVAQADIQNRVFTADRGAARVGGSAFLMERYFANLATALAKSPLVIVDHRLRGAEAPVIDLRSFGAPSGGPPDDD